MKKVIRTETDDIIAPKQKERSTYNIKRDEFVLKALEHAGILGIIRTRQCAEEIRRNAELAFEIIQEVMN